MRPLFRWACAAAVAVVGAAPLRAQTVAEVQVSPQTMTLKIGQSQPIFATAFDRKGNLIPNARFTFWTSDSAVAQVQRNGLVVGRKPGIAKVEARAQGRRAALAVLVGEVDSAGTSAGGTGLTALTLEPVSLLLLPGEAGHLAPQGVRDDGTAVPAGRVTWKSLRLEVAEVDSNGTVVAVAPGRTIIQAASGGVMATAPVQVDTAQVVLTKDRVVLAPDELDTLRLFVPAQANRVVAAGAQWRSTDTTVARVDSSGIVHAMAPGQAEIIASGFQQERRAAVVVHQRPATLVLSPSISGGPVQVPVGQNHKFTATAEAADSSPIPEVRLQWEVGDTTIATFEPATGQLSAKAIGTTSLTVRLAGFPPATWSVVVVPSVLRFERTRVGLAPKERTTIGATLLDDQGRVVGEAADLRWSSDHPEVATVDPQGTVEAVGLGRAVITAQTAWGVTARLDVFVVGDLLVASSRRGPLGIYQALAAAPDSLIPVLVDSAHNTQPVFSPDRSRIAFSSNRAARDGNYDLYVMSADGRDVRRLTSDPGVDGEPAWTPDGTKLVYASTRGAETQLYMVPVDSGEPRPLTRAPGVNRAPAVSPDGKTVAFVSDRDGVPHVYRMTLDGADPETRVGTGALREAAPRYFPNGDLAMGVERNSGSREWRLVRIPAAGGAPVPIGQTEQPLVTLAPSRDGERIVYVTGRPGNSKPDYRVFLRGLSLTAVPVQLKLRSGEQVPSASF
ncbi:MAG TPA: Ig-like domain-containing protein [Gemmatimonadales bacterium]|nr:Ig-like domain-containing protein [Gemmatimonadales bacterium]